MQNLPDFVTLPDVPQDIARKLRSLATAGANSWKKLKAMSDDLGEIPDPSSLSREWLDTIIDGKKDSVTASAILTAAEKKRMFKEWDDLYKSATQHIDRIIQLVQEVGADAVRVDSEMSLLWVADLDAIAKKKAIVRVPEIANEHLQLLLQVKKAYSELREWESAHHLKKIRLDILLEHSDHPDVFAQKWAEKAYLVPDDEQPEDERRRLIFESVFI